MSVLRQFTLAIGSSILASWIVLVLTQHDLYTALFGGWYKILALVSPLVAALLSPYIGNVVELKWNWIVLFWFGIFMILHGTGVMYSFFIKLVSSQLIRRVLPIIGVLCDFDNLRSRDTRVNVPIDLNGVTLLNRLREIVRNKCILRLVRVSGATMKEQVNAFMFRTFIHMFRAIVNPYGGVYPEIDVRNLRNFHEIVNYVVEGGVFVNIADIPLWWAYDVRTRVRYSLVPPEIYPGHKVVGFLKPAGKGMLALYGFSIPTEEVMFPLYYAERHPYVHTLQLFPLFISKHRRAFQGIVIFHRSRKVIENVFIDRAYPFFCSRYKPLAIAFFPKRYILSPDYIQRNIETVVPACVIPFGNGKFLVSVLFLDETAQHPNVAEELLRALLHELCYELMLRPCRILPRVILTLVVLLTATTLLIPFIVSLIGYLYTVLGISSRILQ